MNSQITVSLPEDESIETLSDAEVLALTELDLPTDQNARLSQLLDLRQSGLLTDADRPDLTALMQLYQEGLFRKAQAWREAVRRGLREPPLS